MAHPRLTPSPSHYTFLIPTRQESLREFDLTLEALSLGGTAPHLSQLQALKHNDSNITYFDAHLELDSTTAQLLVSYSGPLTQDRIVSLTMQGLYLKGRVRLGGLEGWVVVGLHNAFGDFCSESPIRRGRNVLYSQPLLVCYAQCSNNRRLLIFYHERLLAALSLAQRYDLCLRIAWDPGSAQLFSFTIPGRWSRLTNAFCCDCCYRVRSTRGSFTSGLHYYCRWIECGRDKVTALVFKRLHFWVASMVRQPHSVNKLVVERARTPHSGEMCYLHKSCALVASALQVFHGHTRGAQWGGQRIKAVCGDC